jgi:N-ethylmaleimide reductase
MDSTISIAQAEETPSCRKQLLLRSYRLGSLELPNRVVMSPMTRGRTISPDRAPVAMEAEYYGQRSSAGLIVTGGTYISPQAIGSLRVPAIFTQAQTEGWKAVTNEVHEKGGRIFLQLGHSGSISHPDFQEGRLPVAPSAINPQQKVFTPTGFKDTVTPRALTTADIEQLVADYAQAARHARLASFDGIELHCANTYLLPQFLSSALNRREDDFGGSAENRARIVFMILDAIASVWNRQQVGIKISPGLNGLGAFVANEDTLPTYSYLVHALSKFAPAYLHLTRPINDVSGTPVASLQAGTYRHFRPLFSGTLIANFGFDQPTASAAIERGEADLISFARLFIANPDLVERFTSGAPIADADRETYYQGGAEGYTSYTRYAE